MFTRIKRWFFKGAVSRTTEVPKVDLPDWPAIYQRLDAAHGLAQRGIHYYLFLRQPEHSAYWITFYFTNLALFKDRVGLHFFINHDPEHIVTVLLANQRRPFVAELLCSPQTDNGADFLPEALMVKPSRCKQLRAICFRGGRFIQPVNRHRINPRMKHG